MARGLAVPFVLAIKNVLPATPSLEEWSVAPIPASETTSATDLSLSLSPEGTGQVAWTSAVPDATGFPPVPTGGLVRAATVGPGGPEPAENIRSFGVPDHARLVVLPDGRRLVFTEDWKPGGSGARVLLGDPASGQHVTLMRRVQTV